MQTERNNALTLRYVFALSLIALLSITAFFTLRFAITEQESGAAIINVAGRQRMLSQRISRFALLYVLNAGDRENLRTTLTNDLELFEDSHTALINGGSVRGLSSDEVLILSGNPSETVSDMYFASPMNLNQQVKTFIAETRLLLADPTEELTLENTHLAYILEAARSNLLSGLNTVTGQYQKESESAIANLQFLESIVLGITLLSLLAEAFFIFRPMVSQITKHTHDIQEGIDLLAKQNEVLSTSTRALATVAEISTSVSSILNVDDLLLTVVDLTKERFNLYHSHIYLLDEKGENLVLAKGSGEAGRIMAAEKRSIPLNREQSLVARAARERKGVTVNDVTLSPDFLPNPLLPDTRAELAVPMLVGQTLIGVFDIQSDVAGRFTETDVNIQTTLAAQLASSVQNARSFERSRSQVEFETLVNTINQKIQRTDSVEETLQTAIRELGTAIGTSRVKAVLTASSNNSPTA